MSKKKIAVAVAVAVVVLVAVVCTVIALMSGRAPGTIRIGAILPLTGDAAAYGKRARQGIELAVDEVNASGGIGGRKVQVIYEDSRADAKTGVSAFTKLATVDRTPAIIGPMGSSVALAIAPLANSRKVVLLSPSASAPKLTQSGPYVFRNVASDTFDGHAMASFCREELELSQAAIIYVQNDFGLGLRASFAARFEQLGGQIVADESFQQGGVDFRAQVAKVQAASPDCVFVVGYKEMGRVLRQCYELGLRAQYLSFSMFEDPDILKQAGSVANGTYYTYRSYDPAAGDKRVEAFVGSYRRKYGGEPDIFAALSFDAARILLAALESGSLTAPEIRDRLFGTEKFPGVTGETTFDKNGDVSKPMGIKAVRDGQFVWVRREYPAGGAK